MFFPPETFNIVAPASILSLIFSWIETTVTIKGISIVFLIFETTSFDVGEFTTTPIAPLNSASNAKFTTLFPWVIPPPTPQKTGTSAAITNADVINGWGVNGYTAIIASAFVFLIIATSVVNNSDFILFPNILFLNNL